MGTSTSTRKRSANGAQGIPKTFGVQFWLEDPDDLDTLRSRLIIPQSDGTEKTEDVVEDFAERVLRFRARDLARERAGDEDEEEDDGDEIRPIRNPKRKSRFDEDDDDDEDPDEEVSSDLDSEEDEDEDDDRPRRDIRQRRR